MDPERQMQVWGGRYDSREANAIHREPHTSIGKQMRTVRSAISLWDMYRSWMRWKRSWARRMRSGKDGNEVREAKSEVWEMEIPTKKITMV
jgi:hypothetical protein